MLKDATKGFDAELSDPGAGVLPCQLRPSPNSLHARSGERLLMLALLADAINIFLRGRGERRLLAETRNWIRGGKTGSEVISFEDACDALGIDPNALRERLFELRHRNAVEAGSRRSSLTLKPPGLSRGR
jgi:hypothetical protein